MARTRMEQVCHEHSSPYQAYDQQHSSSHIFQSNAIVFFIWRKITMRLFHKYSLLSKTLLFLSFRAVIASVDQ
ncbi:hypothetical protein AHF37_04342 [Paragonimus kellicotti]|nr:hypothetical protein AHF37_04342 [Paragonimus kellicotti]